MIILSMLAAQSSEISKLHSRNSRASSMLLNGAIGGLIFSLTEIGTLSSLHSSVETRSELWSVDFKQKSYCRDKMLTKDQIAVLIDSVASLADHSCFETSRAEGA